MMSRRDVAWLAGGAVGLSLAVGTAMMWSSLGPGVVGLERGRGPRAGEVRRVSLGEEVEMEVVWVPGGTFEIGMTPSDVEEAADEAWGWSGEREELERRLRRDYPRRTVEGLKGFWIGRKEVTRREWASVTGEEEGVVLEGDAGEEPKTMVSWERCQEWLRWLNERLDADGVGLHARLPKEEEWEWAARGATMGSGYRYSGGDDPGITGWYVKNAGGRVHRTGMKAGNELGLLDMSGNASEWCDAMPMNTETGDVLREDLRVLRGGSWKDPSLKCHVAVRDWLPVDARRGWAGLRVVFEDRAK